MKILYLNPYYHGGGAEKVVRQMYHGMKEFDIETFCMIGRWQEDIPCDVSIIYEKFGDRAVTTGIGMLLNNTLLLTCRARRKIIELIQKENIDIVHIHNMHSNYLGLWDIQEISKYCKGVVITLHDMWIMTGGCAHACECDKWLSQGCSNCNGNYSMKKALFAKYLYKKKREVFDNNHICYVTPSKWLSHIVQAGYLKEHFINVINNGVDLGVFIPHDKAKMRKKYQLPQKKKIIMFTANGINNVYKGFPFLLEALNQLNHNDRYALLIVGNKQALGLPIESYCMGYVSSEDTLSELYSAADLYIHPSMADVYPFTPMESIASGTPVLAFDTGGVPEIVGESVGWLVERGNSKELQDKIELIFREESELDIKARQCREYAEKRFGIDSMLQMYAGLYQEVLKEVE